MRNLIYTGIIVAIVIQLAVFMMGAWPAIYRAHNQYKPPAIEKSESRKETCRHYLAKSWLGKWFDYGAWELCGDLDKS